MPVPPRVRLSDVHQATLTSPPISRHVSTFTDSAANLEFAALRDTDDIDFLKQNSTLSVVAWRGWRHSFRLTAIPWNRHTQWNLAAKTKENELLNPIVKDSKHTLSELKMTSNHFKLIGARF